MASEVEPASAPTPVSSPDRQHYQFFWEFLTFKVDCVLFQLPKYRFVEDSPTFAGQYGIGLEHTDPNGSGARVIELDATPPDFEYFIKAMYPKVSVYSGPPDLTMAEWTSVLKLSTKWFFNDLRKIAIEKLTKMPMDPVYRVCMAKEYNVSAWLLSGYEGIATRTVPLKTGEASRIGWESALMISSVIIRRLRAPTPEPEEPGVPAVSAPSNLGLANDIMYEFATEFEAMKKAEGVYLTKKERLEKEMLARREAKKNKKIQAEREVFEREKAATEEIRRRVAEEKARVEEKENKMREELYEIEEKKKKLEEEREKLEKGSLQQKATSPSQSITSVTEDVQTEELVFEKDKTQSMAVTGPAEDSMAPNNVGKQADQAPSQPDPIVPSNIDTTKLGETSSAGSLPVISYSQRSELGSFWSQAEREAERRGPTNLNQRSDPLPPDDWGTISGWLKF